MRSAVTRYCLETGIPGSGWTLESFNAGSEYYINWLQPRRGYGLKDYFEFDILPKIKGLYSKELVRGTELNYAEPCFDGVFLTHAHADHVNHIQFIDENIPVFLGEDTRFFLEAMEKTSNYAHYGPHKYHTFRTGDVLKAGSLEVHPIHVDHSIPAAYGYVIYTSENTIVYTEDMRISGTHSEMTREFLRAAMEAEPDVMICEGIRMARKEPRRNLSEEKVASGVRKICLKAGREGKAVIFTQPSRDIDRWRTFYEAAVDCGRVLVIHPRTTFLLERLQEDEHLTISNPLEDDWIRVYYKRKKSGTYSEKDYYTWERRYLDRIVTAEELREAPSRYLINLAFYSFTELIDIRPEAGSHFIYSMSEPFTEEDLEEQVLQNWLRHFGLKYHQLHASGHMSRKDLEETIKQVKPEKLFPVHTEGAMMFREVYDRVELPVRGREYAV